MAERMPKQPAKPKEKPKVVGKSVANEKMNPAIQNNGPRRLKRQGTQLRGRGRVPGTVTPRRVNRVVR